MSIEEIQVKILELLYPKWFESYLHGEWVEQLPQKIQAEPNKVYQALELLLSNYLIERESGMYRITVDGIDAYERILPPSDASKKVEERKMVLEILKETYEADVGRWLKNDDLARRVNIGDFNYLSSIVEYLERKALIEAQRALGHYFEVRLSPHGFKSFLDNSIDMSMVMANAYAILFRLENHLRAFVESKLRDAYGSDWWEKGVSQGVRKKVNQMQTDEKSVGWPLTVTKSNTEYLLFEHIDGIITTNWKEVFQRIFKDQQKIQLKLKELEDMRNAIAHTRLLSQEGMVRLEQYSQDIVNMTS